MQFDFDESERQRILAERGLDFADAGKLLAGVTFTAPDRRQSYGKACKRTYCQVGDRTILVVWTELGGTRCIVTMDATEPGTRQWISQDEAAEITDADRRNWECRIGNKIVTVAKARAELAKRAKPRSTRRRGKGTKPVKVMTTLRIPPDALARWRATGPGWQTRMVAMLIERQPANSSARDLAD